ncbi:MAG: iron-siderophore ABC transporter substrate-binding protein [Leptolyngbyaceae cyanobacterium RM1_406_9]|nr:iron-siderophore ABC transporter substrate-binding protein [Leptolyngbyaceae cyanobacterium RM1_406_9]
MNEATLSYLLAIGIKPIASVAYSYDKSVFARLSAGEDIIPLWTSGGISLEKVLLLKPDLILGQEWESTIYPLLSQIAPTVLYAYSDHKECWKDQLHFIADILSSDETEQRFFQEYRQKTLTIKSALKQQEYQNKKISFVFSYANYWFTEGLEACLDQTLEDVGLQRLTEALNFSAAGELAISEEALDLIDGDILFVGIDDNDNTFALESLSGVLWQNLKAVKNGQVYFVNTFDWRSPDPLAANQILDDLQKYLVTTSHTDS